MYITGSAQGTFRASGSWHGLGSGQQDGWPCSLGETEGLASESKRSCKRKAVGCVHTLTSPESQRCLRGTLEMDRSSPDGEF